MNARLTLIIVAAYGAFAGLGGALSWFVNDGFVLQHPSPYWQLPGVERELVSMTCGAMIALVVVVASRISVQRSEWGRQLHRDLRPIAVGMSTVVIVLTAVFSSLGEELFFRSFLTPWIGVIPQAAVFAVLHQVSGRSRWVWVSWAAAAGLAFGGLYWAVGTLSGPLLAHAAINGVNLAFLRDYEPLPGALPANAARSRSDTNDRTLAKRDAG